MTKKKLNELAKKIFEVVEKDLRDRKGIRHEWDRAEEQVQEEIRTTNQENISALLEDFGL